MKIQTRHLGLAAYLKMHDGELLSLEGKMFVFDVPGDRTLSEWEIQYSNSPENEHDLYLVELRNMLSKK